jgi:hypothetical protein
MGTPGRRTARRWPLCLGLLAVLLQLAAAVVPMPAMAGTGGAPAWLTGSVCRSDGAPAVPDHPVCPVCFVLAQAAGAVPPSVVTVAAPPVAAPPAPVRDSQIPVPGPSRELPARGPPAAA